MKTRRGLPKKTGYSVGCFVVQKDVAAQRFHAVFSIGQTGKLREAVNRDSDREPHIAETALAGLIEQWPISKAQPPKQMEGDKQRQQ
eukprot:2066646-Pyramimonas_sp.AAC.1